MKKITWAALLVASLPLFHGCAAVVVGGIWVNRTQHQDLRQWLDQEAGTLERHFAGVTGLLALQLDAGALGATPLVEEDSYGSGHVFPHAYGPIPVGAVVAVVSVA